MCALIVCFFLPGGLYSQLGANEQRSTDEVCQFLPFAGLYLA